MNPRKSLLIPKNLSLLINNLCGTASKAIAKLGYKTVKSFTSSRFTSWIPKFDQENNLIEVSFIDNFENHLSGSFNERSHRLHQIIFSLKNLICRREG